MARSKEQLLQRDKGEALNVIVEELRDSMIVVLKGLEKHHTMPSSLDSWNSGFNSGVEMGTLLVMSVALDMTVSGHPVDEIVMRILDMIETVHYAGHVLSGRPPRCATIDAELEIAQSKATILNILRVIKKHDEDEAVKRATEAAQKSPYGVN